MTGIILITHGRLGRELINAAEFILGKIEKVECISIEPNLEPERLHQSLTKTVKQLQSNAGILILTDMFGGTPNNISLAFHQQGKVEVVTGVNLPMVIKAVTDRKSKSLTELAGVVGASGRDSISVAGEILSS